MEDTDNKQIKSRKESFQERFRGKHPEGNFDAEEDFYGRVNDDYDEYEKQISDYKKHEDELSGMFTSDPRSASFLTSWRKGEDPAIQLVRMFGTEIKDVIDDPERLDEISKANAEYLERVAREKGLEEEYEKNLAESLSQLETMQKEEGLTDEQVDQGMELLATISKDFIVGKITPETMRLVFNAINHDMDVATAEEDAEVRGRNSKIEEKLRKRRSGDGTASLDGKNAVQTRTKQRDLGALNSFGDGTQTIWERGGEKRRKA